MSNGHQTLRRIATEFREAIIKSKVMPDFPSSCCKLASAMLAKYLVQDYRICADDITYIYALGPGNYEDGTIPDGHFWLCINGLYLDITAGQFPELKDTIVVTSEWIWESRFSEDRADELPYAEITLAGFHLESFNKVMSLIHN